MTITVIHCWSAPRSRSTALLYSFQSRSDCLHCLDEPLYRDWLLDNPDEYRPYRDLMLNGENGGSDDGDGDGDGDNDGDDGRWTDEAKGLDDRLSSHITTAVNDNDNDNDSDSVVFIKHMAKHAPHFNFKTNSQKSKSKSSNINMNMSPTNDTHVNNNVNVRHVHMMLIRDPISFLKSWHHSSTAKVHNSSASIMEVGITPLLDIYGRVVESSNHNDNNSDTDGDVTDDGNINNNNNNSDVMAVVDAEELARDPATTLKHLCQTLKIGYRDEMLSWDQGPKECDGPWANWWYANVHQSTGWNVNVNESKSEGTVGGGSCYKTVSPELMPALRASLPVYDYLVRMTLKYKNRIVMLPGKVS